METFSAIIRGDLSPAGNAISLEPKPQSFEYPIDAYYSMWVDSGTSALALALMDVKARACHIKSPKVIIPGYCCPDLVAAAVFAGVKPVVVDICVDDPSYDLDALRSALDETVVAVIAVNFLGIKERLNELKLVLHNTPVKIIEDNAQWFPASKAEHDFCGDYIVFSFGRGKPLSLLGGGVLFAKAPLDIAHDLVRSADSRSIAQRFKIHLYNLLLHPRLYCYLNRAPFLHLGETHYHLHENIKALNDLQKEIFSANCSRYEQRGSMREQDYDSLFTQHHVQYLGSVTSARRKRLLRYPLLCQTEAQRDELLAHFNTYGLGASPLYKYSIVEIPQVFALVEVHGDLKNAQQFSRRLLTLPTHERVTDKHISRLQCILNN